MGEVEGAIVSLSSVNVKVILCNGRNNFETDTILKNRLVGYIYL